MWIILASKTKLNYDGTLSKFGFLDLFKYRIKIVEGGYEAVFAADGYGTPGTLRIADDLSRASLTGKVQVTFYEGCIETCRTKWISLSLNLQGITPAFFSAGRDVSQIDGCRTIQRFDYRERQAQGSGKVNGIAMVTSDIGEFGNLIYTTADANIMTGACDFSTTVIPA